jgi:hypothetical protein
MPIRRKSDKDRPVKQCSYLDGLHHEAHNQFVHEQRQQGDPLHDPLACCWCCCDACTDLTFYHRPRNLTY